MNKVFDSCTSKLDGEMLSAIWILAKVAIRFMESLNFLNIIFTWLPVGKSIIPGEFNCFDISPLKSLNTILFPDAKLESHRDTWTGCI